MEETAERAQGRAARGAAWIVFVFVIPALVALILVAIVLQVIGAPIMKTVDGYVGLNKPAAKLPIASQSAESSRSSARAVEKARYRQEVAAANRLRSELQAAEAHVLSLTKKVGSLEGTLKSKTSTINAAKSEAQILTTMPAANAAGMLSKLPVPTAARVVSEMTPSISGGILSLLPPAKADEIMVQASSLPHA